MEPPPGMGLIALITRIFKLFHAFVTVVADFMVFFCSFFLVVFLQRLS